MEARQIRRDIQVSSNGMKGDGGGGNIPDGLVILDEWLHD